LTLQPWPQRHYIAALIVLTASTGAFDAVSFAALDQVFTGNMTGNLLFIAFGVVGIQGIPLLNNIVAMVAFLLGAIIAQRSHGPASDGARITRRGMIILVVCVLFVAGMTVYWFAAGALSYAGTLAMTAVLAGVLGGQAAVVKGAGLRDLSTVVVTMVMVNLATDSPIAGGTGSAWVRRCLALVSMALGALVAAYAVRHFGGASAMVVAASTMTIGVGLLWWARIRELRMVRAWQESAATAQQLAHAAI
jgi:uncharacterized membrane protein YoaK (UPF0700 family)